MTTTMLWMEGGPDTVFFEDTEQGLLQATEAFKEEEDRYMRHSPQWDAVEGLSVFRVKATGKPAYEDWEALMQGDYQSQGHEAGEGFCTVWWNRYPEKRYKLVACHKCPSLG